MRTLVESGQIPADWLAEIDGKTLERHPPVSFPHQAALPRQSQGCRLDKETVGGPDREVQSGLD